MKVTVTTFVDYQNATHLEQQTLIEKLKLESVVFRTIEGKSILELNDIEFDNVVKYLSTKEVITVDPLLENAHINDDITLEKFEEKLEKATIKAKAIKAKSLIYRIPKFLEVVQDKERIMMLIRRQISIVKKYKIDVLIMPSDDHKTATYRYILEELKDLRVKMIYHPIYLYKQKEASVTAYRLLRDYIGLFLVDDCDTLGTPKLISTGDAIDLKDLFKKFITNDYEGYIVLDTNLMEVLKRAPNYSWMDKTFNKHKKNEVKVYEEYIALNKDTSSFQVIKVQLLVLYLVFLNKKNL